jgi:hypothetical protein
LLWCGIIVLDPNSTDAMQLLALVASILAPGIVYWLVRVPVPRDPTAERTKA